MRFCLLKFSVAMSFCIIVDDKEWKFKEQRAEMCVNIAQAKRHSRPRGFNIARASDPAVPTPLGSCLNADWLTASASQCKLPSEITTEELLRRSAL